MLKKDAVNPSQKAYLIVYGVVADVNEAAKSFVVNADQYFTLLKTQVACVVNCAFPDSPRWKNNKPIPTIGSFITVGGPLSTVCRGKEGQVLRYDLEIDTLSFLGKSAYAPANKGMSAQCYFYYITV